MRVLSTVVVLLLLTGAAAAQRGGWFGRGPRFDANPAYDGRFTFTRIRYDGRNFGWGGGAWSHDYPDADRNLPLILRELTSIPVNTEAGNVLDLEDPEIFKYPLIYIIEVGWWMMTDLEARNLRTYLDKGGFVIVDDFKLPGGIGGGGWDHFAANMQRVLPDAQFVDLDVSHPVFHQFFSIPSLDIIPQAYNAGRPYFLGLHRNNDRSEPLQMVVFYNTDISQYWEWSERGFRSIEETNEAYKLGVNAILYGLTH